MVNLEPDPPLHQGGEDRHEAEEDGILLYYKYAPVPDVPALVHLYESNCKSLALLGRVRIALDGVNVTIGGKMAALKKHIEVMRSDMLFEGTDFKLASCSGPHNESIARECGFTSLVIRVVKELVTFSSHPLLMSPSISNAGRHLSPLEFHSVLNGNNLECNRPFKHEKLVLLDARNLYETRIGMFHNPSVETLNPEIRQYSDLPTWIDEHSDQLKGNHVLMYCTGGIRCEMASAYIRSKGSGFENVFQLYGGIQRYLEHFPDGGFFKGKNFVFDHRISVGSKNADILGKCILCGSPFDDYSSRCRCSYCRMLVLVCRCCQKNAREYACEICQSLEKVVASSSRIISQELGLESSSSIRGTVQPVADSSARSVQIPRISDLLENNVSRKRCSRKLRILCLHGFRQNASSFKGRMASVAKKLKNMAELVFVDAPHELAFIYQQCQQEMNSDSMGHPSSSPPPVCKRRFAWLVTAQASDHADEDWKMAAGPFDPYQYQQQTDGFEKSYAYLKAKISETGPFDGILGFSQGAAMTALVCEKQQESNNSPDFRFAVICSGFPLSSGEKKTGSIKIPSLHVFGSSMGGDRQIDTEASMKLAELFDSSSSKIIEHGMGHIIPAKAPYIGQMQHFLEQFL